MPLCSSIDRLKRALSVPKDPVTAKRTSALVPACLYACVLQEKRLLRRASCRWCMSFGFMVVAHLGAVETVTAETTYLTEEMTWMVVE